MVKRQAYGDRCSRLILSILICLDDVCKVLGVDAAQKVASSFRHITVPKEKRLIANCEGYWVHALEHRYCAATEQEAV